MTGAVGRDHAGQTPSGTLRVRRVDEGAVVILHVAGEVDTLTAPKLDQSLSSCHESHGDVRQLVLDLSGVPFFSSAGLAVLLDHHAKCVAEGVDFRVAGVQRSPRRAIEITELDRIIPLHDTVSEARTASEEV